MWLISGSLKLSLLVVTTVSGPGTSVSRSVPYYFVIPVYDRRFLYVFYFDPFSQANGGWGVQGGKSCCSVWLNLFCDSALYGFSRGPLRTYRVSKTNSCVPAGRGQNLLENAPFLDRQQSTAARACWVNSAKWEREVLSKYREGKAVNGSCRLSTVKGKGVATLYVCHAARKS